MKHVRLAASVIAIPGLMLAVAGDAWAQPRGTIEVGAFGRVTRFDDDIRLDPAFGAGARLAYLVRDGLALELSAAYAASDVDRPLAGLRGSYLPVSLRLVLRDSLTARTRLLLGGGLVRNHYGLDYDTYEYGGSTLLGVRWLATQWLAIRTAGIMDFMLSPSSGSTADFNFAAQIGATVQLNRVPPRDSDFDGIPDARDECPRTRPRVDVGLDGCPLEPDEDVDGVPDARDRCPNTPVTAVVDAQGCPRFPDTTRVAPPPRQPPPTLGTREGADHPALIAGPERQSYIRASRRLLRSRRARL